jgi:glycosyltransferase involved in cell wall biosynthesis
VSGTPSAAVVLLVRDPRRVEPALARLLPGRRLRAIRREEVNALPPWRLLRYLAGLRVDEIVLLTDDLEGHERVWRLQALGAFPIAPRRYLLDVGGRRRLLSAGRFLARDLPRWWAGAVGAAWVLARTRRRIGLLRRAPRRAPAPAAGRRVCYLRTDLWSGIDAGGSVAHTAGVVHGLLACGAAVDLIATRAPRLIDPRRVPVRLVPPDRRYEVFREIPCFAQSLRFERAAARALAARPADLLYQRFDPGSHAGVMLARRTGAPLVLEYNGSEVWVADHWDRPFRWRGTFVGLEAVNLRHADLIVVVSEALRQDLLARGVEPGRLLVQPNGVDPERYRPDLDGGPARRRHGLEGRVVVGFIGTFGVWHGAPVLARAARRVLRDRPEARFLFVGDGATREEAEGIVADQGGRCLFTGTVPQEEGPAHLAAMDVLVSPHVPNADGSRFFGSPTKLFEYMAMGRGIVASRLEQIGEILADGDTALLVPPADEAALAGAIVRLIDDADLRARLGAAARRRALERHTWEAGARALLERLRETGLMRCS